MKKLLSVVLFLCMAFSLCTLCACGGESVNSDANKNLYEDFEEFDSYVSADSQIIGTWKMTSPETNYEWQFFANTTLHQTRIEGDKSMSTVCTYNFDDEGNLKVYVFTESAEHTYTADIEGKNMTVTDEDGTKMTFTKK